MLARRPANPLLRRRLRPPAGAATDQQDNKKNIMFHRVRTQARCAAVAVLALVAAVLVSACATRWQDKLKIEAEQHLQQGEFFAAARNVAAIDERFPDDAAPLWPMLTAEPARSRLAVTAPAELATPAWQTESGLRDTLLALKALEKRQLLDAATANALRNTAYDNIVKAVTEAQYPYRADFVAVLAQERGQNVLTARYATLRKRVLEVQKRTPIPDGFDADVEAMAACAFYERPHGKLYADFAALLPKLKISTHAAGTGLVYSHFSAQAGKSVDARRAKVFIQTLPDDPLLQADLARLLGPRLPMATFVDKPQGAITVRLRTLRYEERDLRDTLATISLQRFEVSHDAVKRNMPDDARYLYERRTGGLELEYAFEAKVGNQPADLLRGTIRRTYTTCQDARIVPYRGRPWPASDMANSIMERECSGTPPSIGDARAALQARMVDWLARQPVVGDLR